MVITPNNEAIIYLAAQRGCTQSVDYRSYHTFSFGSYFNQYKKAIGSLTFLNDDTLKESHSIKHQLKEDTMIFLIPLVGACEYKSNTGAQEWVDVGQSCCFTINKNEAFEISNPYEGELINYLCMGVTGVHNVNGTRQKVDFDLELNPNNLVPIFSNRHLNVQIHLGKFRGREEGTYKLNNPSTGIFVMVIDGAFEVQNRLLQPRDGLFLNHVNEIEFEALSNEAILLVVDGIGR